MCCVIVLIFHHRCFCFRDEFSFRDCDDICMCVVKMQFELLEFLIPFMLT